MKKKLQIAVLLAAASISFSSCTKFYACECTNYKGDISNYTVTAKTRSEANKNCMEHEILGSCKLMDVVKK